LRDLSEQWQGIWGVPYECAWGKQHIIVPVVDSQAIARPKRASGVVNKAAITTMNETRRIAEKASTAAHYPAIVTLHNPCKQRYWCAGCQRA